MAKSRFKKFFHLSILILMFILMGCTPRVVTPMATPISESTLIQPSKTSRPTVTDVPTQEPDPTDEFTATPIASSTPEPTQPPPDNWEGAAFYTAGFLKNWDFFIAVQLKEEIKGSYYAVVEEGKTYYCSNNYSPRRLYCTGPLARLDDWVKYEIFDKVTNQSVFKGEVFIPLDQQNAIPVIKK